jgi:hypothetical protein
MPDLFCFFVRGMFLAEFAVFADLDAIRIVFLVFVCLIIALLALSAGQRNRHAHISHPAYQKIKPLSKCR